MDKFRGEKEEDILKFSPFSALIALYVQTNILQMYSQPHWNFTTYHTTLRSMYFVIISDSIYICDAMNIYYFWCLNMFDVNSMSIVSNVFLTFDIFNHNMYLNSN